MDKDKQLKMVLGIVILIFVVMALAAIFKPRHKQALGFVKEAAQPEAARQEAESVKERRTSLFRNWGRDPFTVGASAVDLSGDLVLSGIVWDSNKPYCIINEKVVKTDDDISGYKVMEIKKDSVSVRAGDQIRVLKVGCRQ